MEGGVKPGDEGVRGQSKRPGVDSGDDGGYCGAAEEEAEALAAANKRVANILAKQNVEVTATVNIDESLLAEDAEKALYVELKAAQKEVEIAVPSQDYTRILTTLATLRNVIDNFFDNVMVMADDEAVKHNRLALLSLLRQLFLTTADISILAKS